MQIPLTNTVQKSSNDVNEAKLAKQLHRLWGWKDACTHKWNSLYEKHAIECGCSSLFTKKTSIEYRITIACEIITCICDFIDAHSKIHTRTSFDMSEQKLANQLHNFRGSKN